MPEPAPLWRRLLPGAILALIVFALFAPALRFDFIQWDDPEYVYMNRHVMSGLSLRNVVWAFSGRHESWWLPLVWISYMADVSVFGAGPMGHHLTNILLHAANVLLLFWVLYRTTGSRWRSLFVAALFGVHPLRLESVVWVTERKDVLSGLFWMLGLLAHVRYAEAPSERRRWLIALLMLMGLMSKTVLVTFPFTLLLMDFWPLRRFEARGARRALLSEKLPLFVLSAAFACFTLAMHKGARGAYAGLSWLNRLNLMPRNYLDYLGKLFWPANLSLIYPENDMHRWGAFVAASAVLLLITAACLRQARARPFLVTGWCWFLVALLPLIRGVHLGLVAMADRYTYIPSIGLFIALAWGAVSVLPDRPWRGPVLGTAAALILAAAGSVSAWNLQFWRNSETILTRAMFLTSRNYIAAFNLANHFLFAGKQDAAMPYYEKAIEFGRGNQKADHLTAVALWRLGRLEEATALFEEGLRRSDKPGEIHSNLGLIWFQRKQYDRAIEHFNTAIRINPSLVDAHFNLALALHRLGRNREAMPVIDRVLAMRPEDEVAWRLKAQIEKAAGGRADGQPSSGGQAAAPPGMNGSGRARRRRAEDF